MFRPAIVILILLIGSPAFSGNPAQIVEEMKIKWWVVPVFAVAFDGQPVTDLKKADIQLRVNRESVRDFHLIQREMLRKPQAADYARKPAQIVPSRRKMVFLVVDLVYTGGVSLKKYKAVIRDMVTNADENSDFLLFTISGFKGLVYHTGPTRHKNELLQVVDGLRAENTIRRDDYIRRETARMREDLNVTGNEYRDLDIFGLVEGERMLKSSLRSRTYRQTNNYFQSFRYLYYIINSLQYNKFVYLFSRGIPRYAMEDMGPGSVINRLSTQVEHIVRDINTAGAVLNLINPVGVDEEIKRINPEEIMTSIDIKARNIDDLETGEFFVRQLALQSGGKYFEGTVGDINDQLADFHQGYYELAFSDIRQPDRKRRSLNIATSRKGIRLFTFHSVKEQITYGDMDSFEKKLHVVNALLGNVPISRMIFDVRPLRIVSREQRLSGEVYYLDIPSAFVGEELDFYTLHMGVEEELPRIVSRSLVIPSDRYQLTVEKDPLEVVYFMFIKGDDLAALAYGSREKAAYYHLITVVEPRFHEGMLSFDLQNYRRSPRGEGMVMVQVCVYDREESELYRETKVIVPNQPTVHIKIPFTKVDPSGIQYVLIRVKDLLTERSAVKMLPVHPL